MNSIRHLPPNQPPPDKTQGSESSCFLTERLSLHHFPHANIVSKCIYNRKIHSFLASSQHYLMYRPLVLTGLAATLFASSCDKVGILNNERAKLDAEIQEISKEMASIDDKFESLRKFPLPSGMTLERHLEESVKKNAELEGNQAALSKTCAEAEAALSVFRPRLATYKAKYLY